MRKEKKSCKCCSKKETGKKKKHGLRKALCILAGIYAGLFAVFYFDLDGKLLFKVVEPALVKRYDNMERRNPLEQPYKQIGTEYMKNK